VGKIGRKIVEIGLKIVKIGLKIVKIGLKMGKIGLQVGKIGLEMGEIRLKMLKIGLKIGKIGLKMGEIGLKISWGLLHIGICWVAGVVSRRLWYMLQLGFLMLWMRDKTDLKTSLGALLQLKAHQLRMGK
jgi:hypothetical protein